MGELRLFSFAGHEEAMHKPCRVRLQFVTTRGRTASFKVAPDGVWDPPWRCGSFGSLVGVGVGGRWDGGQRSGGPTADDVVASGRRENSCWLYRGFPRADWLSPVPLLGEDVAGAVASRLDEGPDILIGDGVTMVGKGIRDGGDDVTTGTAALSGE